ncbi:MAG: hypothetical protein KJ882_10385 [Proteobacteria bacterium]|nr:hypothetical protein [Pseudomonadota bacterium]
MNDLLSFILHKVNPELYTKQDGFLSENDVNETQPLRIQQIHYFPGMFGRIIFTKLN